VEEKGKGQIFETLEEGGEVVPPRVVVRKAETNSKRPRGTTFQKSDENAAEKAIAGREEGSVEAIYNPVGASLRVTGSRKSMMGPRKRGDRAGEREGLTSRGTRARADCGGAGGLPGRTSQCKLPPGDVRRTETNGRRRHQGISSDRVAAGGRLRGGRCRVDRQNRGAKLPGSTDKKTA